MAKQAVCFRLDATTLQLLDDMAARDGRGRSEVLRQIIRDAAETALVPSKRGTKVNLKLNGDMGIDELRTALAKAFQAGTQGIGA